jgi:hypothetical protein
MLPKSRLVILSVLVSLLLSACQKGEVENIVGRWELDESTSLFGTYEFYESGTGVFFRSPHEVAEFTYTFDSDGTLKVTYLEPVERTIDNVVAFESSDEIVIEQSGLNRLLRFVRKPLLELPPRARVWLAITLVGTDYTIVEAEILEGGRGEELEGYDFVVAETDIVWTVGSYAEEWLVTLRVNEENEPRKYVLQEGEEQWGVIRLIKGD